MSDRRLYLIRHGRADQSSEARRESPRGLQWDPPLDETGLEQAGKLARRLLTMPRPAAMYSSPLRRARQTAAAYADAARVDVAELEDLAEWFAGAWESKSIEQIVHDHPEAIDLFRNQDPAWHLAPGGETGGDFQRRVVDAIEGIIEKHPVGDIFVVAHGGVINAYFGSILGMADREMFFLPENTSINTVVVRDEERVAWFLSDVAHLTDPHWFE